ncbi:hypothetical protein J1614_005507 [Plenodomus biglobosus]|nr:hypothetical protein J1614_005507 [Plenodomus biglobosus]
MVLAVDWMLESQQRGHPLAVEGTLERSLAASCQLPALGQEHAQKARSLKLRRAGREMHLGSPEVLRQAVRKGRRCSGAARARGPGLL